MSQIIKTISLSIAFTVAGAIAYEAAKEYAKGAATRRDELNLPQGNPGIPDPMKESLKKSFNHR